MKVLMYPHLTQFGQGESGIRRVVEAYYRYLPQFDIELVTPDQFSYDLTAIHAGVASGADVAHNHGLYWTDDLALSEYEWRANVAVINSLREARQITVPSEWVAETIRRDMRLNPHVIGHGIEWADWQHPYESNEYVLWNKNRDFDVCNPEAIVFLAQHFPQTLFMSTFAPNPPPNLRVTGQVPFEQMRQMVLGCKVYLSSVKETFGIGTLEAMAAGKPILGWANGGNLELVHHGVNGYLAQPGNNEDLANGLDYCLAHAKTLGDNGREMAKGYDWPSVCEQVARVYRLAYEDLPTNPNYRPTVGVVIPSYNKSEHDLSRAVASALRQTFTPEDVIVINDGSPDPGGFEQTKEAFSRAEYDPDIDLMFISQGNSGVAAARNHGISRLSTKYICCLDGDDWIDPTFLEECIEVLEKDYTIGIAYTGLMWHNPETGQSQISDWPGAYVAAKQFDYERRQNQIPTCCVFRRDAWARVGGYRSRYCPDGAGSEDAALWTQILAIGYTAKQVTTEPLFHYSLGGQVSSSESYREIDWLAWLPYTRDKRYPFACSVLPVQSSHPVRQYDEPELSVIIPVGPGHETDLRTALDSIEAQHFRNWEAIVALDTGNEYYPELYEAYPFVKWAVTGGKRGAGYSRNLGVSMARGRYLLFLDADDFLNPSHPLALGEMIQAYRETGQGVYSAHIGRAIVSEKYKDYIDQRGRLLAWNETLSQAYIYNPGIAYDCELAIREPGLDPQNLYVWNLITTLIPRRWHDEVGGFDEELPTWEDWDYWLRMAKGGKCFHRIEKPFVIYNYISGNRRETGRQIWSDVLSYLQEKHKKVHIMACGCGKKKTGTQMATAQNNGDMILCRYIHPNPGRHHVVFNGYNYGRHNGAGQETFPVRKADYDLDQKAPEDKRMFAAVNTGPAIETEIPPPAPPPSPPAPLTPSASPADLPQPLDMADLPANVRRVLAENSLTTKEAVNAMGKDGLVAIKGIGPATAAKIMELAQ